MANLIIESIGRPIEKDFSKTSVAHARNAVIIADIIDADIITCERDMHLADGKTYDNIICSYSSPYMKYKKLIQIVEDNPQAKLWWLVNDHDLEDNILLRNVLKNTKGERKINMICNNPRDGYRGWILRKKMKDWDGNFLGFLGDFIDEWHTVNLNCLIYNPETIRLNTEFRTGDCIYWGTFRKYRLPDIIEYQGRGLTISATPRTQKKFIGVGVDKSGFMDKLKWVTKQEDACRFKYSLYIEDVHTHDNYAFMANRYYEALMCGLVTIFDEKCAKNIELSGFRIDKKLIVSNRDDMMKLVDNIDDNSFNTMVSNDDINRNQAKREKSDVSDYLRNLMR